MVATSIFLHAVCENYLIFFFLKERKKEKDHAQQYLKIIFCKKAKKPYKHIGLRVPSFTSQLCSSAMY